MHKIVYTLPNGRSFAFVARSGSTSLGLMALRQFNRPEARIYDLEPFPSGVVAPHRHWGGEIVDALPPATVVVVREPLSRFRSLVARTGIAPDAALAGLYWLCGIGSKPAQTKRDWIDRMSGDALYHFRPVCTIVAADSVLIPFPDIETAAVKLGITVPAVRANASLEVPVLSNEQESRVLEAYAGDSTLFNKALFAH